MPVRRPAFASTIYRKQQEDFSGPGNTDYVGCIRRCLPVDERDFYNQKHRIVLSNGADLQDEVSIQG